MARPPKWQILTAFSIIYLVWGSTFLAVRVSVQQVPPFLLAAVRFLLAGTILYAWMRLRGVAAPTRREWVVSSLLSTLIFVLDYGCLFWAEQRVPSGIAAVVLATIPVFITLLEIIFLKTQRLTLRLGLALLTGICGVSVLMNNSFTLGEVPIDRAGALALLVASVSWSFATVFTNRLSLPASKPMSAAAQMLSGGVQLVVVSAIAGEFPRFHIRDVSATVWMLLIYLIVAGSIVGYTAYVWLLHHESPTKVGTYAYVNPVIAVALGHFLGAEAVGMRTLLGTLLVLVSVVVITTAKSASRAATTFDQDGVEEAVLGVAEAD